MKKKNFETSWNDLNRQTCNMQTNKHIFIGSGSSHRSSKTPVFKNESQRWKYWHLGKDFFCLAHLENAQLGAFDNAQFRLYQMRMDSLGFSKFIRLVRIVFGLIVSWLVGWQFRRKKDEICTWYVWTTENYCPADPNYNGPVN